MPVTGVKYDHELLKRAVDSVMSEYAADVERVRYSTGNDWADEPAVFFRVLLKDPDRVFERFSSSEPRKKPLMDLCLRVIEKLDAELHEEPYFPYVEFRTVAEQDRLRSPEWN